jgi:hypothetical protein
VGGPRLSTGFLEGVQVVPGYAQVKSVFHGVPGREIGRYRFRPAVIPARFRPDTLGRSSRRVTTTGCERVSANARRYHVSTPGTPRGTTLWFNFPFEYPCTTLQRDYVLNSGTGEFGRVDPASGRFEPIAFLSGYGRGLAFAGPHHAVVGLSEPRENRTFAGLVLQERLERERVAPRCGLMVVDLRSGDVVHWLRIEGVVRELYDVALLPGRRNPAMIGFRSDEIRRTLSFDTDPDAAATSYDTRSRTDPSPG